ncbi:hypothetical protein [Micromonospora coriariae]|uniref:hypothetical protein n=1 Tax=Micromonospora coriariae TaxID=285665 RepID=UPI0012FDC4E5|nr:hypothetical protein [Micromonospora coriariae]
MNADPFTGNRDAFGGSIPISKVEVDGHFFNMTEAAVGASPGVGLSQRCEEVEGFGGIEDGDLADPAGSDLHPVEIAARTGRFERTIRRHWPPSTDIAMSFVNGPHARYVADPGPLTSRSGNLSALPSRMRSTFASLGHSEHISVWFCHPYGRWFLLQRCFRLLSSCLSREVSRHRHPEEF